MNPPIIVLIRPQLGENIGAVARAMGNFGLSELRIVAPRDGWPSEPAAAMAAGSLPIIEAAQVFESMEAALFDVQAVYATTARPREMEKRVVMPDAAMEEINSARFKAAIVFGPERTGLTNEDLGWCHYIITIPTAENASLNIAQSAVVVLYEWWKQAGEGLKVVVDSDNPPATMDDYAHFFTQLEAHLDASQFFKLPEKKPGMWLNIKNMFLKASYSGQELRTMHGIVRALSER